MKEKLIESVSKEFYKNWAIAQISGKPRPPSPRGKKGYKSGFRSRVR